MTRLRRLGVLAASVLAVTTLVVSGGARAANSPTFRDCALVGGLDPDFVQLSGVRVTGSQLTVPPSQGSLTLVASESSDPGDSSGHVTLAVSVASPHLATQKSSGAGVGKVVLQVPLTGSGAGRTYTISWSATFDNGNHACPSMLTPANQSPMPFTVTVAD